MTHRMTGGESEQEQEAKKRTAGASDSAWQVCASGQDIPSNVLKRKVIKSDNGETPHMGVLFFIRQQ